jgi:hypothetical protein
MIVGYARVGTDGQSHDAQQVAGRQAPDLDCEPIILWPKRHTVK